MVWLTQITILSDVNRYLLGVRAVSTSTSIEQQIDDIWSNFTNRIIDGHNDGSIYNDPSSLAEMANDFTDALAEAIYNVSNKPLEAAQAARTLAKINALAAAAIEGTEILNADSLSDAVTEVFGAVGAVGGGLSSPQFLGH